MMASPRSPLLVLTVVIMTQNGRKIAGVLELNVWDVFKDGKNKKQLVMGLDKCPDKSAKIHLKISFREDEEKSMR